MTENKIKNINFKIHESFVEKYEKILDKKKLNGHEWLRRKIDEEYRLLLQKELEAIGG